VQQPFDVSKNGLLKITIAKWFTPNDKNIDKEGITPDILIEFKKEDYTPEK
jgi:carboxyl-terminal processing protease